MELDLTNFAYELVSSSLEGYHEVCVSFTFENKKVKRLIYVKNKKGEKKQYYINEAKKRIEEENKSGRLFNYTHSYINKEKDDNKRRRLLIILGIFMGVAAIIFAVLFTYNYFTGSSALL